MKAIFKKELCSYINSPIGYMFAAGFMLIGGVSFVRDCLIAGSGDMSAVFSAISVLSILIIPMATVQMFTMEKRQGAWTMLLAAPVDPMGIVLGKFLAAATVAAACVATLWIYAAVLSLYTTVFISEFVLDQIGLYLLMLAFIAMGELISAMSKRRLTAAAMTVAVQFLLFIISLSSSYAGSSVISGLLMVISPYTAYEYFSLGLFSLSGTFYLITFAVSCILLTARCVDCGRVRGA